MPKMTTVWAVTTGVVAAIAAVSIIIAGLPPKRVAPFVTLPPAEDLHRQSSCGDSAPCLCKLPKDVERINVMLYGETESFAPGKYKGRVVIENLNACEEFGFDRVNRPPGPSSTDVFLTVSPQDAVMLLEYEISNTKAADYFETKAGTLAIQGNHMIGGIRHRSFYYFDMTFTQKNEQHGRYVGKGTWIIQDGCEAKAPAYRATISLEQSE